MEIQFIVDVGEFNEPEVHDLPDDIAKQHLKANHAVKVKPEKKDSSEAEVGYASKSVKELDALLDERDLKKGGNKGEKVFRLEADDDLTNQETQESEEEK